MMDINKNIKNIKNTITMIERGMCEEQDLTDLRQQIETNMSFIDQINIEDITRIFAIIRHIGLSFLTEKAFYIKLLNRMSFLLKDSHTDILSLNIIIKDLAIIVRELLNDKMVGQRIEIPDKEETVLNAFDAFIETFLNGRTSDKIGRSLELIGAFVSAIA